MITGPRAREVVGMEYREDGDPDGFFVLSAIARVALGQICPHRRMYIEILLGE